MTEPIAVDDAEIEALMDELEAEIGGVVAVTPAPAAPPVPPAPAPVAEPEPKPEPVKVKAPAKPKLDEELEDLESAMAEIAAAEPTPEPKVEPKIAASIAGEPKITASTITASIATEPKPAAFASAPVGIGDISEDVPAAAKAQLQFFVDVNQFNRDTKLTEATLDQAMMEQAGLRAFYGAQAANAEGQHARLKVRFDVLEAKLYDEHRKNLAAGGEKVTEKMVENAVKLDPRWSKAKNAVIEAETIASVNKALSVSLADRRDMMIQLGADRREEFKGAARVLAAQDERDSMAQRAAAAAQRAMGSH